MFRRILVAIDGSDTARAAFVFVSDWARNFEARVWFIQLTDESSRRRCEIVTDVRRRGRQLANHFSVSGAIALVEIAGRPRHPAALERAEGRDGPGDLRRPGRVGNRPGATR